jgi:hypothetical protein
MNGRHPSVTTSFGDLGRIGVDALGPLVVPGEFVMQP